MPCPQTNHPTTNGFCRTVTKWDVSIPLRGWWGAALTCLTRDEQMDRYPESPGLAWDSLLCPWIPSQDRQSLLPRECSWRTRSHPRLYLATPQTEDTDSSKPLPASSCLVVRHGRKCLVREGLTLGKISLSRFDFRSFWASPTTH